MMWTNITLPAVCSDFLTKESQLYVQVIPTACFRNEAEEKKRTHFCQTQSFDLAAWADGILGQMM